MSHNFIPVLNSTTIVKGAMVKRWHCNDCDSTVEFDVRVTQHEVNRVISASLKCMEPIKYKGADKFEQDPNSQILVPKK